MKRTITRQVFFDAKAMLMRGKKQLKIAKKLKIATGTVSKIKNSKSYTAYCGKKTSDVLRYSGVNLPVVSGNYAVFPNFSDRNIKKIDMTDIDRNIALENQVKKLQVEVKKNPAFAKLVASEVALAMTDRLTKATADKQETIDTQAKRIGELTVENGDLRGKLIFTEKNVTYKEEFWKRFDNIGVNLSRIVKSIAFLFGFMWITWLLVSHVGL